MTIIYFFFRKDYPPDTVILHQLGRGPYAPSLTPFAVKLETYLRMAKIPYMVGAKHIVVLCCQVKYMRREKQLKVTFRQKIEILQNTCTL